MFAAIAISSVINAQGATCTINYDICGTSTNTYKERVHVQRNTNGYDITTC